MAAWQLSFGGLISSELYKWSIIRSLDTAAPQVVADDEVMQTASLIGVVMMRDELEDYEVVLKIVNIFGW